MLDAQTRLLLVVNGLFVTANALSGTFMGVYLWKASHSFALVGWFTLLTHLLMAVTFWAAGNTVKEGSKLFVLRLGIGASAGFYALVLLLGKRAVDFALLLGVVQGLASGLFWLAYNVIYFEATEAYNRDRYNGLAGAVASAAGIVVPWFSGVVISLMAGGQGYRVIFALSLVIFLAGALVSLRLRDRKPRGSYDWFFPLRIWGGKKRLEAGRSSFSEGEDGIGRGEQLMEPHRISRRLPAVSADLGRRQNSPWPSVLAALAAQGARESVFGVLIGLLVYQTGGSELKLGNFTLLTSAIGFLAFYAAGKWLKPAWRNRGMAVGALLLAVAVVPLTGEVSYRALTGFGIVAALFAPLYLMPMTSAVFDLIGTTEGSAERRVEYVVVRELALNAGRLAGMAAFLVSLSISLQPQTLNLLLLAFGCAPLLGWFFMRRLLAVRRDADNPGIPLIDRRST